MNTGELLQASLPRLLGMVLGMVLAVFVVVTVAVPFLRWMLLTIYRNWTRQ